MIRSINFDLCDPLVQTAGDASPAATAGRARHILNCVINRWRGTNLLVRLYTAEDRRARIARHAALGAAALRGVRLV